MFTSSPWIDCFGKREDMETVNRLRDEMRQLNIQPDTSTFSSLIDCFGKRGDIETVNRLRDEMKQLNIQPDVHIQFID